MLARLHNVWLANRLDEVRLVLMILPRDIRPRLEELEPIVRAWPVTMAFDRVVDWLLQFDPEDYDLGARIVRHLNVIGQDEMRRGLSIAYTRLQRKATDRNAKITNGNTIFAAIGDVGKSGAMMAYEFRITNELPEANFAEDERDGYFQAGLVENVVLIDDVIGTGDTAVREAKRLVEETTSLGVRNVFVLAMCGFEEAVRRIEEEAGTHAFAAFTYNAIDTAATADGDLYSGLDHTERIRYVDRLKYYNNRCARSEMGYGSLGALVTFRHNTPNVSLPVIWGSGNGWTALFPRIGRIAGIERYHAQILAAQHAQKRDGHPKPTARAALVVTVLVEGKTDEAVMDVLISHLALVDALGVKSITTVSIGGVMHTTRLFDLLRESGRHFIMVLDGDPFSQKLRGKIEGYTSAPVVLLKPNFVGLFDLEKLAAAIPAQLEGAAKEEQEGPGERVFMEYERILKARGFGRSMALTESFVTDLLDQKKVQAFVDDLRKAIDALLEKSSPRLGQ